MLFALFLLLVPVSFSLPCGDYANVKELGFTYKLERLAFLHDPSVEAPTHVHGLISTSTATFVNYFQPSRTALFLTAAHSVSQERPLPLTGPVKCGYLSFDIVYASQKLTDTQELADRIQQDGGYGELKLECYNPDGSGKAIDKMHAFPLEIQTSGDSDQLVISRVRKYSAPSSLDVAIVIAGANPQFVQLWEAGKFKQISMPPRQLDRAFENLFTRTRILLRRYPKVRAGGSGSTDRIECRGERAVVPMFSNFAVKKFLKLAEVETAYDNKDLWHNWPIGVDDAYMRLQPKNCKQHSRRNHTPAHGLRSTCHGDSGGPVYLPDTERPILIGVVKGGSCCTHESECRRKYVEDITTLITGTEVRTWYDLVNRLLEQQLTAAGPNNAQRSRRSFAGFAPNFTKLKIS